MSAMTPLWHVTLPPLGEYSEESHFAPLPIILEGLTKLNRHHIAQAMRRAERGLGPPIPPLYRSGVVYKEDPPGQENWCDVYEVLKQGHADCDRLVAWRAAELQEAGIEVEPVIKWQHLPYEVAVRLYGSRHVSPRGLWLVHCLVRWPTTASGVVDVLPDGTEVRVIDGIEDPSKVLGMGKEYGNRV